MHIIITLAGHSRRFKEAGYNLPKFLLSIDGQTMLEHVVGMFDLTDNFHFVLHSGQLAEYPELNSYLKSLAKKSDVTVIEPHELGPVYSALQVKTISEDEPVIISYCDFLVLWNYKQFLRLSSGYDAAIPAFRGFHPASFGDTHYAYMRVNDHDEMLELSEKKSFTDTRHNEWASAGIYYFKHWHLFKYYGNKILKEGFGPLKEGYASLLSNLMVADNLKIKVTEVEKFICWGTPEDLEQYYFWSRYFNNPSEKTSYNKALKKQTNLIPMAGKGSRFLFHGYRANKPLIQVRNKPMVIAACESFPPADKWIFLPRQEEFLKHNIKNALEKVSDNVKIIPVEKDTSGQLATCLLAKEELDVNSSLFIASCDYETRFSSEKWLEILNDDTIDGAIWTFRMGSALMKNPKAFAYCSVEPDSNRVIKIVEKQTISDTPGKDPLVVGSFWFRDTADFLAMANTAIEQNLTVNGEHYVGNSINILIAQGKKFVIFDIDQWISYGDPFELQVYYYWEEFFEKYSAGHATAELANIVE